MLLLLTLLFKELLFHGASTVGEKKQGGKIPVVGNSWGRRSSREDLGAGSNAPAGCPWNLHARLVSLGKVSLSPVSVSLSDFGRRKLAQRIDDMGICANCISISFFSYVGPSSPTLSYFLTCHFCLSDLQVLRPHHLTTEETLTFHLIQISSFANKSWAHTQGSGWLGELQTHRWNGVLGTIQFLWPWSRGNFSKEELKNIQALLQLYLHGFPRVVQAFASQFQFECEFVFPSWYLSGISNHLPKWKMVYGLWPLSRFSDLVPCIPWLTLSPLLYASPPSPL